MSELNLVANVYFVATRVTERKPARNAGPPTASVLGGIYSHVVVNGGRQ